MTTAELDSLLLQTIAEIQADIEAYEERAAIQETSLEARMHGKTTTDYAIQALREPDTSCGKRAVARAWLRNYEPHIRVFVKVAE